MLEPRRLTTVWAFTACYRDIFMCTMCNKMIGAVSSGHNGFGNPRRSIFPTWNETDLQFTTRMAHRFLRTVSLVPPADVLHFFLYKGTRCLTLLMLTPNAVGRWGITLKLSSEGPLKRTADSYFANCSTQNGFCSGVAITFVTSRTERKRGVVRLRRRTKL
jgi:hypothetical protein